MPTIRDATPARRHAKPRRLPPRNRSAETAETIHAMPPGTERQDDDTVESAWIAAKP